jgi:hypothetical protein
MGLRRLRRGAAAAAVLALALAAGAATSGAHASRGSGPTPAQLLAASEAAAAKVRSFRVDGRLRLTLVPKPGRASSTSDLIPPELLRHVALSLRGPVVVRPSAASLRLNAQVSFVQATVTVTRAGDDLYVSIPEATYKLVLPQAVKALLAQEPTLFKPELLHWIAAPRALGVDTLAGYRVFHLGATLDSARAISDLSAWVAKLDASLPPRDRQDLGQAAIQAAATIGPVLRSAHVDLWIGERDLLIHRLRVSLDPTPLVNSGSGELSFVRSHADLQVDFSQFDQPFRIARPHGAKPLDLDNAFQPSLPSGG